MKMESLEEMVFTMHSQNPQPMKRFKHDEPTLIPCEGGVLSPEIDKSPFINHQHLMNLNKSEAFSEDSLSGAYSDVSSNSGSASEIFKVPRWPTQP